MRSITKTTQLASQHAEGESFRDARKAMRKAFENDDGLYISYHANVAMLLHDRYGLTDKTTRDQAAEDLMKLVFDVDRGY